MTQILKMQGKMHTLVQALKQEEKESLSRSHVVASRAQSLFELLLHPNGSMVGSDFAI